MKAPIPNKPRILARLCFDDRVRTLAFAFVFERYAGQDLRVVAADSDEKQPRFHRNLAEEKASPLTRSGAG